MKSGTYETNDGKNSMIYRGIEDIYGNIFQYVDGININNYISYYCTNIYDYNVDTFTGCYKSVGYTNLTETNKYISKLGYDANNPLVSMPIETNLEATDSTYTTDYYFSASGNRIARVGGMWSSSNEIGMWLWSMNAIPSAMQVYYGARLLRTN